METREIAHELLEYWPEPGDSAPDIEAAIYAQANNRIFGVVFWFALKSGQFDDLDGPALGVVLDDDNPPPQPPPEVSRRVI